MNRRQLLTWAPLSLLVAGIAGCSASPESSPSAAQSAQASSSPTQLERLQVHVPTTLAFMAPMASFGTLGNLDKVAKETTVENWASVDALKSLLVNGETDLAASPSYAGPNLYNKGVDVRLVAIAVWGMIYLLGPEGTEGSTLEDLRGKKVAVPLPNNMPDLVFRYLLTASGIPIDQADGVTIQPYDQAPEAANALTTGQVDYAVLPEHVATVTQAKAKEAGKILERTVDLQQAWATATGREARFPMAGVVMPGALAESNPALVGAVLSELEAAVEKVNTLDPEALAKITAVTEVPEALVTQVIPRLQLQVVPAESARSDLEDFYTRLMTLNADVVGGKLPDDGFYLADPR